MLSIGELLGTCTRGYLAEQQVQHASGVGHTRVLQQAMHAICLAECTPLWQAGADLVHNYHQIALQLN